MKGIVGISKAKSALIIGYGSIGRRHHDVLHQMGMEALICSRRKSEHFSAFTSLQEALDKVSPGYIVIANETSEHIKVLNAIHDHGYIGPILVEKPVFSTFDLPNWSAPFAERIRVGYNLRFHPALQKCKSILSEIGPPISIDIRCGQYLPDWRPDQDYRFTYSAKKSLGGGVLRDLSHEIDYCQWLAGGISDLFAVGGHFSRLEITSDDIFNIIGSTDLGSKFNIHLNYIDRVPSRTIVLNCECDTLSVDLISGELSSKQYGAFSFHVERNDTYKNMHESILKGENAGCTFGEGLSVLKVIDACEQSAISNSWQGGING
jgi:predicted dehydrogenase